MRSYTPCDPVTRVVMPYILPARSMGLRNRQCIYCIYIVPNTSGESKNNIGLPKNYYLMNLCW